MILDLKKIFLEDGAQAAFDYQMDLSETGINGSFPFVSPVSIKGTVKNHSGAARFTASVSFDFSLPCDRCAVPVERHFQYSFSHAVASSLQEESDDYIQADKDKLDVDELVRADVLLELPTKYLCAEDCKGLCPSCGKNLNEGACGCDTRTIDPRLEALKNFIN